MASQLSLIAGGGRQPFDLRFYVGTHMPHWLHNGRARGPLFVSIGRLSARKSLFPRATVPYAIDSGAYTELHSHGAWQTTPAVYVSQVRRVAEGLGAPDFAAVQDWLCDPGSLKRTGLSVREHQQRTLCSYLELRDLAPEIRWIPVLQGDSFAAYLRHADLYEDAGVGLSGAHVGLGSIVRRQHRPETAELARRLAADGLRLHGFGVKTTGLVRLGRHLESADSIAWSYRARREGAPPARNSQAVSEAFRAVAAAVARADGVQEAECALVRVMGPPAR